MHAYARSVVHGNCRSSSENFSATPPVVCSFERMKKLDRFCIADAEACLVGIGST